MMTRQQYDELLNQIKSRYDSDFAALETLAGSLGIEPGTTNHFKDAKELPEGWITKEYIPGVGVYNNLSITGKIKAWIESRRGKGSFCVADVAKAVGHDNIDSVRSTIGFIKKKHKLIKQVRRGTWVAI